jgi:hypothetical protein
MAKPFDDGAVHETTAEFPDTVTVGAFGVLGGPEVKIDVAPDTPLGAVPTTFVWPARLVPRTKT